MSPIGVYEVFNVAGRQNTMVRAQMVQRPNVATGSEAVGRKIEE